MRILELQAENVKRLRAVDITPDGTLQVIGGRNAQGKSSVLDAIWLALGGGKAAKETALPIRDGEKKASVRLDLGDLVVSRSWTAKGTTLKVESADGAQYKSPQAMLDKLVGSLSFDPLAFTRLSAKDQKTALLDLVQLDIDLDALEEQAKATFENRTRIGKEARALGEVTVDETLPEAEQSASAIIAKIREAEEQNRKVEEAERAYHSAQNEVADIEARVDALAQQLEEARATLYSASQRAELRLKETKLLGTVDTAPLESELSTVEETNQAIRANNQARGVVHQKSVLQGQYEAATDELKRLEKVRSDALAGAQFPVAGLGFDENGVTYRGLPFSQASSAEQIRVSVAMAMAMNPKLRVLRIKDGSLLDADAMEALRAQVAENDFQLWLEVVTTSTEGGAVIIEDGEVAE